MDSVKSLQEERERPRKKQKRERRDARLSELPNDILHQILSFMDMKSAIQTSILSSRYIDVWKSLPFLNFSRQVFDDWLKLSHPLYRYKDFANFIHKVLLLRDSVPIKTFRLIFDEGEEGLNVDHIDTFIRYLIMRHVQEIVLQCNPHPNIGSVNFPNCLFNCQFLTTLKLDLNVSKRVDHFKSSQVSVPSPICLPSLRILHLKSIWFIQGDSLGELLSNCPSLETLVIRYCIIYKIKVLTVSFRQLKHLELDIMVKEVMGGCKIVLSTPKLLTFYFSEFWFNQYNFVDVSSLEVAGIYDIQGFHIIQVNKKRLWRVMTCLRAFHNVKSLSLPPSFFQILSECPSLLESSKGLLNNLRCLNLTQWICRVCFSGLLYLLDISFNVETLVIRNSTDNVEDHPAFLFNKWKSSLAKFHHLKFIEVWNVPKQLIGLEFLKFMLQKAINLEQMTIYIYYCPIVNQVLKNFAKELFKVHKEQFKVRRGPCARIIFRGIEVAPKLSAW